MQSSMQLCEWARLCPGLDSGLQPCYGVAAQLAVRAPPRETFLELDDPLMILGMGAYLPYRGP
ncbi:MAG TPA: hypothetical protein VK466_18320, partial [Terriglobales bacterium]|nr:hypothetical protein [Terriglobales bacterium]